MQWNVVCVYFARKVILPEGGTFCSEIGVVVAMPMIVQLRRDVAWLRSSTNGLYLFQSDAPDATDFAVVITLPLLVLTYSRGTVWSLVNALFI